jgi:hypothetical protein
VGFVQQQQQQVGQSDAAAGLGGSGAQQLITPGGFGRVGLALPSGVHVHETVGCCVWRPGGCFNRVMAGV